MKTTLFFQLILNLCLALLLFVIGVACALSSYTQEFYKQLLADFAEHIWAIPLIGILLMLLAWAIVRWTFPLMRKGHFEMVVGQTRVWIEQGVFEKMLKEYLAEKFPEKVLSAQAFMRGQTLELIAEVPSKTSDEEVERMSADLRSCLQREFGYIGSFSLSLNRS
jgi:hypothetical protein